MTSSYEGACRRGGVVKSVMPVAEEPLLLAVAAWKGHGLEPIIRDSHYFGVSMIDPTDRVLVRRFSGHLSEHGDQFDSVATERDPCRRCRILSRSIIAIDCEVVRHFDIEADHELYIGLVLVRVCSPDDGGFSPCASDCELQIHQLDGAGSGAPRRSEWNSACDSPHDTGNGESQHHTQDGTQERVREASRDPRRPEPEKARDRARLRVFSPQRRGL